MWTVGDAMTPRLTVLILAYNALDKVMRCHQALKATTDPAHTRVLIQDDASPLYNGPLLFGEDVCQRNSPNLGFAASANAAARRATTEFIMLLNQDTYTEQRGWDRQIVSLFDEHAECGIVGPTLLFPDGRVQSVGGEFDAACQPSHVALGFSNPDWGPIATPRVVEWITGAAFVVRASMWRALGGFDEGYHAYFEDCDCAVRAQLAGWQVWHEPRVRMVHEVGSTGGSPYFQSSAKRFKEKWVDTGIVQPDTRFIREHFWA